MSQQMKLQFRTGALTKWEVQGFRTGIVESASDQELYWLRMREADDLHFGSLCIVLDSGHSWQVNLGYQSKQFFVNLSSMLMVLQAVLCLQHQMGTVRGREAAMFKVRFRVAGGIWLSYRWCLNATTQAPQPVAASEHSQREVVVDVKLKKQQRGGKAT